MADELKRISLNSLETLISDISERWHFARWHIGIEYEIFKEMISQLNGYPTGRLTDKEITRLFDLCLNVEGWLHWPESAEDPVYIPLNTWVGLYRDHFGISLSENLKIPSKGVPIPMNGDASLCDCDSLEKAVFICIWLEFYTNWSDIGEGIFKRLMESGFEIRSG